MNMPTKDELLAKKLKLLKEIDSLNDTINKADKYQREIDAAK